jgi:hypothetical protein
VRARTFFRITKRAVGGGMVVFAALLLCSCSAVRGRYKMYPGRALPRDQVAILRSSGSCYIRSVDGKKVSHHWGMDTIRVELLPGPHTVWVYCGPERRSLPDIRVEFNALPGHTYAVRQIGGYSTEGWGWTAEVIDVSSQPSRE